MVEKKITFKDKKKKKNIPPNAGDMGLIPGQGAKTPQATGHLSPFTLEPKKCN